MLVDPVICIRQITGSTNKSTLYDNRATTAQYESANTTMKNILYYNHGDQILFKNYVSGSADYYTTGVDPVTNEPYSNYNLFSLYRVDASVTTIDQGGGFNTGTGFYRQFTWYNNQLRDWRKNNIDPVNYYCTQIGAYGDPLIYTLEAGYKYVLMRQAGFVMDTPLWIYVDNPVQSISTSYTPISGTIIPTPAIKNRKSIALSKSVGTYSITHATINEITETINKLSFDYEVSTGFNFDETTNKVNVFDGNYNNLTNKPLLGTINTDQIKLINVTSTDSNVDYKIWSSNNDFKITSSVSSIDTDRFIMSSDGNVSITNELVVSGNRLAIQGSSPTLFLRHSVNRTAFIHNNGDLLYFLGGAAGATDTQENWNIVTNGRWSLTINLNNNNATFGGDVNVVSLTVNGLIEIESATNASLFKMRYNSTNSIRL